jgi:hypothetical protein
MMHPSFALQALEPEVISAMNAGFEAALKALHDTGQPQIVLEVIASRIITAARLGERNPGRLRKAALPWLSCE